MPDESPYTKVIFNKKIIIIKDKVNKLQTNTLKISKLYALGQTLQHVHQR